jgi:hypothetical protein
MIFFSGFVDRSLWGAGAGESEPGRIFSGPDHQVHPVKDSMSRVTRSKTLMTSTGNFNLVFPK